MKSGRSQNEKRHIESLLKSKSSHSRNAELDQESRASDPGVESCAAPQQLTLGNTPAICRHPIPGESQRQAFGFRDRLRLIAVSEDLESRYHPPQGRDPPGTRSIKGRRWWELASNCISSF
jgi:hypothetical protein